VIIPRRMLLCSLMTLVLAPMLRAGTVTPLHEGWPLRSACKLRVTGGTIGVTSRKRLLMYAEAKEVHRGLL
jgi:hypothetical protein